LSRRRKEDAKLSENGRAFRKRGAVTGEIPKRVIATIKQEGAVGRRKTKDSYTVPSLIWGGRGFLEGEVKSFCSGHLGRGKRGKMLWGGDDVSIIDEEGSSRKKVGGGYKKLQIGFREKNRRYSNQGGLYLNSPGRCLKGIQDKEKKYSLKICRAKIGRREKKRSEIGEPEERGRGCDSVNM